MIYNIGKKEYALAGLVFGLFFGLFVLVVSKNLVIGITIGVLTGLLYAFAVMLLIKKTESKFNYLRGEISKLRKIVCEGPASLKQGEKISTGWIFLSEDAIEFYSLKTNDGGVNVPILLDNIVSVKRKSNQIIIETKSEEFIFAVIKAELWKKSIINVL